MTDEEAYPLTYQLLLHMGPSRYSAITGALAEGRISVVGPPAIDESGANTFQILVRQPLTNLTPRFERAKELGYLDSRLIYLFTYV